MTAHTKDALTGARISQVIDLALAVSAFEAISAKGLVSGQYREVFDLVAASAAAVCTIVADERAVAEKEEVGI